MTCAVSRSNPTSPSCAGGRSELNRVTELDEDPFSDPVDLEDIVAAAERLQLHTDKDWS